MTLGVEVALGRIAEHLVVDAAPVGGDGCGVDDGLCAQTDLGRWGRHGVEAAGDGEFERLVEQLAQSRVLLRGRSWRWLRVRILALLSAESRLARVLTPEPRSNGSHGSASN